MGTNVKLSLVVPCYNEASNLPLLIERCGEILRQNIVEVILVDNGSTDNTREIFSDLLPAYPGCRSISVEQNKGYGFGILAGLSAASGEILGWTHADMQTDIQDVMRGLEFFKKDGSDIFVKGLRYGRPFFDTAFTIGMSAFETILLGKSMWDINAQPTLIHRGFYKMWCNPPHDFSFDLYAYYRAIKDGLVINRFPVRINKRAHGVSRWNTSWEAKREFIRRTINFSLKLSKGSY
jgi:glycosyltransferase involved in cell wall biosynthesis